MQLIRFGATRGVNLDQMTDWELVEREPQPQKKPGASTPGESQEPPGAGAVPEEDPPAPLPKGVRVYFGKGAGARILEFDGEEAQALLGYFIGASGSLTKR